ncbi:GGDEF domain-containing protein (plasmid) [Paenibacillus rhizovicinus]|uniref:GGDEF domain-containing protein n=1 Tax=Paenibacillus rhizovicinus TaxID=2704463 RepID=A0A6C0PC87_9BACL|nr:GGDEF domain-containing protein [Paenibacillus rhizovicinus]QHW35423.1 GGDEF domain-containing protein [Paenibacillus rhizovicinus]
MANTILTGATGEVYYASLTILIMLLMLFLSIRLLISRQKRAYLTLSLCMAFSLLGQILLLGASFMVAQGRGISIAHNLVNTTSFILANIGVYQLYGGTTKKVSKTSYILLGIAALVSFFPLASGIYAIFLVGFAFFAIRPLLDDGATKYQIGNGMYALATLAHFFERYTSLGAGIAAADNLFRISFFVVLFLIILDKVLSLMESSYNKSTRDPLTGLYNRFYFYTTVSFLVADGNPISVVFFDLDNFKKLNDTRGHAEGDRALKAVASILKEESEEVGIAGRYGGEEMVMLIDDLSINVADLAERIRARIEEETSVTASIGYASLAEGDSSDSLITHADKAMYVSKKSGKNRVHGYSTLSEEQLAMLVS